MSLNKKVSALMLASVITLGGLAEEVLKLNTDKEDNRLRQGVVSKWMGVSKVRAEEAENLEEFIEEDKIEETDNLVKGNRSAFERYPELGLSKDGPLNMGLYDDRMSFFETLDADVAEAVFTTSWGEDVVVPFLIQAVDHYRQLGELRDIVTIKGSYIHDPNDPIFYLNDKKRDKIYLVTLDEYARNFETLDKEKEDMVLDGGMVFYLDLFYDGGKFSEAARQNYIDEIARGDLVYNFTYVEKEIRGTKTP